MRNLAGDDPDNNNVSGANNNVSGAQGGVLILRTGFRMFAGWNDPELRKGLQQRSIHVRRASPPAVPATLLLVGHGGQPEIPIARNRRPRDPSLRADACSAVSGDSVRSLRTRAR